MSLKNKTTQKVISCLIIFTMLAPAVFLSLKPHHAEAQGFVPVADKAVALLAKSTSGFTGSLNVTSLKSWAEYIGTQLLKMAAKRILAKMTQATVDWINNGFHGSPLFLENPESFFKDIAKTQIRSIVDYIGYDTFRFPFGKQTALNVIDSYKRQLSDNAQYTLSKVINDPDLLRQYRNDFNYGGWNGFLINTQYPQNNYLGFNMIIEQNLASKLEGTLQAPAQKVQSLLQQGMGFLSPQTCADNGGNNNYNKTIANQFQRPTYKSPDFNPNDPKYAGASGSLLWEAENKAAKATWTANNTCKNLVNTTPGSVVANEISSALNVPRDSATLAGALGNDLVDSIGAIFDALINKLVSTGLNSLASTISPGSGNDDNWSYNGQTLGGSVTINPAPGTLTIPQNVSVSVQETTSTVISGGTAPYSIIQTPQSRAIAVATIDTSSSSGNRLTVRGVSIAPPTALCPQQNSSTTCTTIVVHDSSTPSKIVTVTITVSILGALTVTPANISTTVNNATVATISGGEGNYFIQTIPDQQIAIVNLSGTNLVISGIGPGTTYVEIRDSSTVPKITQVNITIIDNSTLSASQESVLVYTGQTIMRTTFTGTKVITNSNPGVVTVTPNGEDKINIVAGLKGNALVTVTGPNHSTQNPQISELHITVNDKLVATPLAYSHSAYYGSDISGGTAPYRIISCSTAMIVCTPPFNSYTYIEGNRLWVYANGTKGSSSIEVGDASGQTVTIPFVRN